VIASAVSADTDRVGFEHSIEAPSPTAGSHQIEKQEAVDHRGLAHFQGSKKLREA
jgi:hypothetical protein